jgi:hypothetical protein
MLQITYDRARASLNYADLTDWHINTFLLLPQKAKKLICRHGMLKSAI